jgi:hypothetical protein
MKAVTFVLVLIGWVGVQVHAKIFLSCELAKELGTNSVERHLIPHCKSAACYFSWIN